MKRLWLIAALCAAPGCTAALRGPETCSEVHFDATYVLARMAGWPPEEAVHIAASDAWTDRHAETNSVATERRVLGGLLNPLTLPWVLSAGLGDIVFEGEPVRRAIGRRVAEATAWAVPPLGHRLHFPGPGLYAPVLPAFFIDPRSGDIEYGQVEGRRVLERAFLDLQTHDDDNEATLALLGIGLHALQDSLKHRGFNAALGHIGARPDPDRVCADPQLGLESAVITLTALRYARRLAAGSSSPPPDGWKEAFRDLLTGAESWSGFIRERFHDEYPGRSALLERWQNGSGVASFERALERVKEVLR